MIGMSPYLLALLAAVAFALGSVLQQRGSLETKASEGDPHFLLEILKKPVWLLGGALQVMGWILQAAALVDGSLIVVQSICALSLVIALPLGVRFSGQRIGKRSVAGALITLIGIIAFRVRSTSGGTSILLPAVVRPAGFFCRFNGHIDTIRPKKAGTAGGGSIRHRSRHQLRFSSRGDQGLCDRVGKWSAIPAHILDDVRFDTFRPHRIWISAIGIENRFSCPGPGCQ